MQQGGGCLPFPPMQTLARFTATILIAIGLCAQALALPKPPRPPVPKPKRPSAAHNFLSAKRNAGPNTANHSLLLQQQKNAARFQQLSLAARRHSGVSKIAVGSRGGKSAADNGQGIETGNRVENPGAKAVSPDRSDFTDPLMEREE